MNLLKKSVFYCLFVPFIFAPANSYAIGPQFWGASEKELNQKLSECTSISLSEKYPIFEITVKKEGRSKVETAALVLSLISAVSFFDFGMSYFYYTSVSFSATYDYGYGLSPVDHEKNCLLMYYPNDLIQIFECEGWGNVAEIKCTLP